MARATGSKSDEKRRTQMHQLRTHLAILQTTVDVALLKGKDLEQQEFSQTLKKCVEQVNRISKILDDMNQSS